jgi:hypothetical protein
LKAAFQHNELDEERLKKTIEETAKDKHDKRAKKGSR